MTTTASDAARARIEQNHRSFTAAIDRGERHLEHGQLALAAVDAGAASNLATWMHPGLFASGRLERLGADIARAAAGRAHGAPRPRGSDVGRVLHVFSRTLSVGGHTRMVWRWMSLDSGRQHSVAITRQGRREVPAELRTMAEATGGEVTVLGQSAGDVLSCGRQLHDLATRADVVILHVDPEDVVPIVAFGDRSDLPPILYLNHADHLFWMGVGIADLVVNLRRSGHVLSPVRRGVPEERNAFLPIALGERARTVTRADAKRQLGLSPETVLLATVARAVKFEYRSDAGDSYLQAVTPVVQELEQVRLIVVGPEQEGDFQRAHDATGGRIMALGERTDNELLYQAVDVYLDSYPQMSPTSLLEAGSYGTPLLALCPQLDVAAILSGDAPGIDAGLVRARSVEQFRRELEGLVADPSRRAELGELTRADIERLHVGAGWRAQLEDLYRHALIVAPLVDVPTIGDTPHIGPPDTIIATSSPPEVDVDDLLVYHLRLLPTSDRIRTWVRLARRGKRPPPAQLLSEPAVARLDRLRTRGPD